LLFGISGLQGVLSALRLFILAEFPGDVKSIGRAWEVVEYSRELDDAVFCGRDPIVASRAPKASISCARRFFSK
jgi:hypothetical protein